MPSTEVKRLYLLRHAKSSWDDPELRDRDRPLAPRGERAAVQLARHLARERVRPGLVLCSSAKRTRQTLKRILPALGKHVEVLIEDELYAASADALLARLRRLPDSVSAVMVVGHNPGLQQLALALARDGPERPRVEDAFPTGALAILSVRRLTWAGLRPGDGEIVGYVVPRELPRR
jgi:phosphohistidine phosphatase